MNVLASDAPLISVTLISYNTANTTVKAIDAAILALSDFRHEIIVVDNASSDNSVELLSKIPSIELIKNTKNVGFAAAHNQAIAESNGRYILILNSDAFLNKNAVEQLLLALSNEGANFGAVGPSVTAGDGVIAPTFREKQFYSKFSVFFSMLNFHLLHFDRYVPVSFIQKYCGKILKSAHDSFSIPKSCTKVEWVDGMCVLFSREALIESGLFDEQYFLDSEIGDLMIRIRQKGWDIAYQPSALILHEKGSSKKASPKTIVHVCKSHIIYFRSHKPDYSIMVEAVLSWSFRINLSIYKAFGFFSSSYKSEINLYSELVEMSDSMKSYDVIGQQKIPRIEF